jgi:hypothetical protein
LAIYFFIFRKTKLISNDKNQNNKWNYLSGKIRLEWMWYGFLPNVHV